MSSSLDRDRVLTTIARAAAEIMNAPLVGFWIVDEGSADAPSSSAALELGAFSDDRFKQGLPMTRLAIGEGAAGRIAAARKPLAIHDISADRSFLAAEWARSHGLTSFYGVPIVLADSLFGVLTLLGRKPFRLGRKDAGLLETFVAQAAVAMRNVQFYRETCRYAERLRALDEVNRLLSSSLNVDEVVRNIAKAVAQFFEAQYVSVWVFDPVARRLRRSLAHGDPELALVMPSELAEGDGAVGWVVLNRAPIPWTDVEREERIAGASHLLERGLRYFAAYPIAIGDRVLGAFAVNRRTRPSITPETESLLRSLAAQAAVALDHARLYSETSRRLEETAALLEVSEILSSTLDSKQLLKRVAIKIAQVCGVDRCSLELWDGDRIVPLMSQFADGRKRPELWTAYRKIPPYPPRDVPAHARAIETRKPVVIDDAAESDLIPNEWVETYGLRSYMVVPLVRQDQVIGVMNLDYCERVTPFQPWQVDQAMTIAGQLALALENTRLYDEIRERLRETTTLHAVGQVLSEPGAPAEVMRRVCREVGRAFGADMVGTYFLDERRQTLVPLAGYHVPPDLVERFVKRPMTLERFPALAATWREGRAVWSGDASSDPRFDREWEEGLPPHSVIFAPAIARGDSSGALFLVWWRPGREFSPAEIRLVEAIAKQVGLAIENTELARQTQAKLEETETLLSVSRALSSTLDFQGLLRHFLRGVTRAIEADSVGLWMLSDDEWLEPVSAYHLPPHMLESARQLRLRVSEHPFYGDAARTRRPVFSRNVPTDPRIPDAVRAAIPHQSQLFVPIVVNERMVGGFAAVWWERVREFSEGELALMDAIASQAGVAIENARLFQENRRQLDELAALYDLSSAVTGEVHREALLEAIQVKVARALDFRDLVVMLVDEQTGELEVALRVHAGARDESPPRRYALRSVGLGSVVIEQGSPLRTEDYAAECARHGVTLAPFTAAIRYWLGVPLRAGDQVLGVLALRSADRAFTAADERLLTNVGDLVALALRSARLFEERTRAYRELATAQDQLVRTEKLRALGEMASGVAHDFNNLLAAILGRAQLLLRRIDDPKSRQWLEVVEKAATDGAQTVRRLQEFTRIRRDEPLVPVALNQVIVDALEMTQSRWREEAQRRGLTIEVRTLLEDVPPVAGDAAELREALTNLVLNAVDAMSQGGTLTLSSALVGNEVEVTVADTGVGMPDHVRSRIFDPFFTTKGPRGTGLGLSITYGILSRHGATVTVDSVEGRGSSFRLRFPRSERLESARRASIPAHPAPDEPLRCLVVDDDEKVGAVVGDMIDANGHMAVVVTDGASAIARFTADTFDAVFTDLAMPGVSGWQVARAVKAVKPETPVFMITGFGAEVTDEERTRQGVDVVLVKPLGMQDILAALAQVEQRRAQQR